MRLVVDTNVIVSAALKASSWPGDVLRWVSRHGGLLKSVATEQEVTLVLQRPYFVTKVAPSFLHDLARLFDAAELVTVTEHVSACRDPRDDKFLELAINGRADVIISGDADLLVLDTFRGIPIVTPAAFVHASTVL